MTSDTRALSTRAITELKPFTGAIAAVDRTVIYDASKRQVRTLTASRTELFPASGRTMTIADTTSGSVKIGATSGWQVDSSTGNIAHITLPQSKTSSTAIIPIFGIEIGETITGVAVHGQCESAGGSVSITLSVRKLTTAAADVTDGQLGFTTVNSTADTLYSAANLAVTGLYESVAEGETVYARLTATTAASTDIDIIGISVTKIIP